MNTSSETNNTPVAITPKPKHLLLIGIGIIVLFLFVSLTVAYKTFWADPFSKSFKKLYPAAFVGNTPVSIEDADEFVLLAQKMDGSVSKSSAFDIYLMHAKSDFLLKKLGLKLASDAVTDELYFYKKTNSAYDGFLDTYFNGREKLFRENVIVPQVVESSLRTKYNSDYNLNKDAYQKAENVLERLNAGEKFEDLAKQLSDDKQSAQFGGDLGFFEHGQILPELEKAIAVAKTGEVHDIVVTRDGYEIFLPVEVTVIDGTKRWHAKHILIQTTGFESWLTAQLKSISVKKLKTY